MLESQENGENLFERIIVNEACVPYEKILIFRQFTLLEEVYKLAEDKVKVLDIGPGFGHVPALLSHRFDAISGDPFPKTHMLKIWNFLSEKHRCNFLTFDGTTMPFKR